MRRPRDSRSTVAASSATRMGCHRGARSTPVPSAIRSVTVATAASVASVAGMYPSSTKWCSLTQ